DIRIQRLSAQSQQNAEPASDPVIRLSDRYSFNKETNLLYYDDTVQKFTKREHALIVLFVSNLGQVMTDESIRSFIWDGEDAEASTIRSLVNRVRQKLKEELIENMRGFGYIMKKGDLG
ncbi:MAG: winged helix-turn-helix domain-containing protein, partial [Sulfuricurvum sp.]|nr:winged helix-turn-helix domain-containing protein [Sulfuricurvum sp.]